MNKRSFIFLLILIISILLRTFYFSQTLNMGTDQSMAYILANHIIKYQHLLLVGPLTTFWEVNLLPPTYYYIVTLLFLIFKNEVLVSLSFMFAGILAVFFFHLLAKSYFNEKTALISTLLFSYSFQMIEYSRDLWEPHLVPLFVILSFYLLDKCEKKGKLVFYYLSLLCFMFSLMYVSSFIILIPYMIFSWKLLTNYFKNKISSFLFTIISIFALLLITYLPVLIFEASRDFPSINILKQAFQGNTVYLSAKINFFLNVIHNLKVFLSSALNSPSDFVLNLVLLLLSAVLLKKLLYTPDKNLRFRNLMLIIFLPFILTGFYQQKIEIYRFASIFPFIYLLFGYLINNFISKLNRNFSKIFLVILPVSLIFSYFYYASLSLNKLISRRNGILNSSAEQTVSAILKHANGPFIMYTVTPFETHNHHGTSYYYALEKILNKNMVVFNERGNWINQDFKPYGKAVFLICKGFHSYSDSESNCLKNFISENNLKESTRFLVNKDYVFKLQQ